MKSLKSKGNFKDLLHVRMDLRHMMEERVGLGKGTSGGFTTNTPPSNRFSGFEGGYLYENLTSSLKGGYSQKNFFLKSRFLKHNIYFFGVGISEKKWTKTKEKYKTKYI